MKPLILLILSAVLSTETIAVKAPAALYIGLPSYVQSERYASIATEIYNIALSPKIAPGDMRIVVYDAFHNIVFAEVKIPVLNIDTIKARKSHPRLKEFKSQLIARLRSPEMDASQAKEFEGKLKAPQFLSEVSKRPTEDPYSVVLIGDPRYASKLSRFDMVKQDVYPSNSHIVATSNESVFGTADKEGRLSQANIHWIVPSNIPWTNEIHYSSVRRFWNLYMSHHQKGALCSYNSDLVKTLKEACIADLPAEKDEILNLDDQELAMKTIETPSLEDESDVEDPMLARIRYWEGLFEKSSDKAELISLLHQALEEFPANRQLLDWCERLVSEYVEIAKSQSDISLRRELLNTATSCPCDVSVPELELALLDAADRFVREKAETEYRNLIAAADLIHGPDEIPLLRNRIALLEEALRFGEEHGLETSKPTRRIADNQKRLAFLTEPIDLPEGCSAEIFHVSAEKFPFIIIDGSLLDPQGKHMPGLLPKDMQLEYGGISPSEIHIANTTNELPETYLTIALDQSGSLSGAGLEEAKKATRQLLEDLSGNERMNVCIIGFSNKTKVIQPWTKDLKTAAKSIESLKAARNTALYKAVETSIETLKSHDGYRRLLLLSDGADTASGKGYKASDLANQLRAANIATVAIGLRSKDLDAPSLRTLSANNYLEADVPSELTRRFKDAQSTIAREQYRILFKAADTQGREPLPLRITFGGRNSVEARYHAKSPVLALN